MNQAELNKRIDHLDTLLFEAINRNVVLNRTEFIKELLETVGMLYSDAKPEERTTQPSTPETDTTGLSSSASQLGEVLVELDFLISTLTKRKSALQKYFDVVKAHLDMPGQPVQRN